MKDNKSLLRNVLAHLMVHFNFIPRLVILFAIICCSFPSVLMITKASRQNASGFNLQKEEWKQSINISSANFADYGLY